MLTTNGRQVGGIDNSIKEDIRNQNNNLVSVQTYDFIGTARYFLNPKKYYMSHSFLYNFTDGVFRLAGYVQDPLQSTPVYVSVQLLDCPPGFTLTGQQ